MRATALSRRPSKLITCVFAAFVIGCGGAQLPAQCKGAAIAVSVVPAIHLNPDRAGLARSVLLRLFQLRDASLFRTQTFDSVWSTPLLEKRAQTDQLIAVPGLPRMHTFRRDPRATHLAIAANFREHLDDSRWHLLVRLPDAREVCANMIRQTPIKIAIADYALELY